MNRERERDKSGTTSRPAAHDQAPSSPQSARHAGAAIRPLRAGTLRRRRRRLPTSVDKCSAAAPHKSSMRARLSAMRHLSAASRIGTWRSRGRPRRRRRPPPLCQRREPNASSSGRAPAAGCRSDRDLWFVSRRAEPNELSRELSSILGDSPSFPSRRQFAGAQRSLTDASGTQSLTDASGTQSGRAWRSVNS